MKRFTDTMNRFTNNRKLSLEIEAT